MKTLILDGALHPHDRPTRFRRQEKSIRLKRLPGHPIIDVFAASSAAGMPLLTLVSLVGGDIAEAVRAAAGAE